MGYTMCQAKLRSKGGGRCTRTDATPRFTKPLREMSGTDHQPKFACAEHDRYFPAVSPSTGEPFVDVSAVKSFMIREDGSLTPLPKGEQYDAYQARRARG